MEPQELHELCFPPDLRKPPATLPARLGSWGDRLSHPARLPGSLAQSLVLPRSLDQTGRHGCKTCGATVHLLPSPTPQPATHTQAQIEGMPMTDRDVISPLATHSIPADAFPGWACAMPRRSMKPHDLSPVGQNPRPRPGFRSSAQPMAASFLLQSPSSKGGPRLPR